MTSSRVEDAQKHYFGIGVTKFDGNVTDELILESDSLYARYRFYDCRFTVSYVTYCTCKNVVVHDQSNAPDPSGTWQVPRLIVACKHKRGLVSSK